VSQSTEKIKTKLKLGEKVPFLKGQDWLAKPISFYYRGQVDQGTVLGGCLSCCAWLFFFFFTLA